MWSQVNGPAPMTFANVNQPVTQATFPVAGEYQLRLSGSDGQLTSTADVYVSVNDVGAPTVTISPGFATITLPASITLTANATDPNGQSLTYQWSQSSGSGTATFSTPTSSTTQVAFVAPGTYGVQVVVSNSVLSTTAALGISVLPAAPGPPTVTLAAPQDGQIITTPTAVVGSISGAVTTNGTVTYTLAYRLRLSHPFASRL